MAQINSTIFREYDIRGRESNEELNIRTMELLGKAAGTYLARKGIKACVVGRDARATSEDFSEAATNGLLSAGINVTNIGMVTTPMLAWAQHHFKTPGALAVTASHNPKGWNGIKFSDDYSTTITGERLLQLREIIEKDNFHRADTGQETREDIFDDYANDLVGRVEIKKKFKLLVNTGNGTGGPFVSRVLRKAGCDVVEHLAEVDANFPNYTPDPAKMPIMEDTAEQVKKHKADIGFAFDGDADRLGVVAEDGTIISPDIYAIFLARMILPVHPGAKIMQDVKSSQALADEVESLGGETILVPTGPPAKQLIKNDPEIMLGAELVGHMYLKYRFFGHDDPIFTALLLLEYISDNNKPVSALLKNVPKYVSTTGFLVETPDDKKFDVVSELTEEFKKEGYEVTTVDGARVEIENGWGLVRASNTSPNLTLRFEAKTKEGLDKIQAIFREKLSKYDFVSKEWIPG